MNSIVALLEYIDDEIGGIDKLAQILIRAGTTILRERVTECTQIADVFNQRKAGKSANLRNAIR
jgi:hypothetical protein